MTQMNRDDLWLRSFHPAPARDPLLICFPHAGGSASYFFPLSAALAGSVAVLAVQYPGRQDRRDEVAMDNIDDLAASIVTALRSRMDRSMVFFGHSMGAVVAFEVARAIEREAGGSILGLIGSGRRSPSLCRDENVHMRDDRGIIAEMRSLQGTDAGVLGDAEMLQTILPALRNDYKAIETYRYRSGPKLRCPISTYIGDSDPKVGVAEAEAWGEHTSGAFSLRVFPGGHFYLSTCKADTVKVLSADIHSFCSSAG